jgi:predicted DNA-binding transcriptional regulator AlpA
VSANPPLRLHDAATPQQDTTATAAPTVEAKPGQLMRQRDLFALLAVSKATGHRLAAASKIGPRPIRLGAACLRYDHLEVLAWLANRRPDGSLHDARTWPTVWDALRRRQGGGR